jgi:hypothetical protein
MLRTLLLILVILLLIGALPAWPYSAGWGYYPSGGAGLVLVVLIVLVVVGVLWAPRYPKETLRYSRERQQNLHSMRA